MKMARRSIEDLRIIAYCELSSNPTITTYTIENGVEHRRPAHSLRRLEHVLIGLTDIIQNYSKVTGAHSE